MFRKNKPVLPLYTGPAVPVALAGNPNVGKSVLFQKLTGRYVAVSNYPGTTVDTAVGLWKGRPLIDTPGVYALSSYSDEEKCARDLILRSNEIINVIEARHLARDLLFTLQLIDMGKKLLVCVNMMDELAQSGQSLNLKALERQLGVPVRGMTAIKGEGIDEIEKALPLMKPGKCTPQTQKAFSSCPAHLTQGEKVLYLEEDEILLKEKHLPSLHKMEEIYLARRTRAQAIAHEVLTEEKKTDTFSHLLLQPFLGTLFLLGCLFISFLYIRFFLADFVVGLTQDTFMEGYAVPLIRRGFSFLHKDGLLYALLCGEYGLCTLFPTYVFALLLPLMMGFTFLLSLWEDSGFLPRACVLLDRPLQALGMSGRAFLPLLTGFGCVTAGILSTRLMPTKKERRIAAALLGLFIPCSAQMGILLSLLTPLGLQAWLLFLLIMGGEFILCGRLLQRGLKGERQPLLLDLPRLRRPLLRNVCKKTGTKTLSFLLDAAPLFALGCVTLSLLSYFGVLHRICQTLSPVTSLMGLPKEILPVLLMGVLRKDFGAAGLKSLLSLGKLSALQTFIALLLLSLSLPCLSSILMLGKEDGLPFTLFVCLLSLLLSLLTGIGLNQLSLLF